MEFLTSWITNIILFILLAVTVELLLPQTGLQKYVKMVLGLLLIIIFLTPVFKLFSVDIDNLLNRATGKLGEEKISLENSIEKQKIEIQKDQHAYILEQTAVQLEEMTEKELMKQFDYQFAHIQLNVSDTIGLTNSIEDILDNIESIHVTLIDKQEADQTVMNVEEVNVQLGEQKSDFHEADMNSIASFLAKKWGVDRDIVQITIERGNVGR
ncbi:MAG: stage III sporulation protein AF [Caldibacillus thermoamylovorans]|uniref:stage III sporulation protein AF n=1 Tax=Bacillaceae TaxID=186817 RepID=UPI000D561669|nr:MULTISPECIES: stage III sporulation protein AF [Bacillaceae]AWI12822.1 stage III sporulation protein AF [Caldibacillus thermoamylovorans]MBU5344005.1 stage III sporulation protein AF [Caldifermentibacillus hisashii]MCM3053085.1 stage III sporulation protein AF [Caldibacillus thermoamylovorans]